MFYAGPATNSQLNGRKKRSNHFDKNNPITKDAIYDALEHWSNETKSGKTAFQLVAYTDAVVDHLPLSQSIEELKQMVQDMYDKHGDFNGEPSQTR